MDSLQQRGVSDQEKMANGFLLSPFLGSLNLTPGGFLNGKLHKFESPMFTSTEFIKSNIELNDTQADTNLGLNDSFTLDGAENHKQDGDGHQQDGHLHPSLDINFTHGFQSKNNDANLESNMIRRSRGPSFSLGAAKIEDENQNVQFVDFSSLIKNPGMLRRGHADSESQDHHQDDEYSAPRVDVSPHILPKKFDNKDANSSNFVLQPYLSYSNHPSYQQVYSDANGQQALLNGQAQGQNTQLEDFKPVKAKKPKKKLKNNEGEAVTENPSEQQKGTKGKKQKFGIQTETDSLKLKITKFDGNKAIRSTKPGPKPKNKQKKLDKEAQSQGLLEAQVEQHDDKSTEISSNMSMNKTDENSNITQPGNKKSGQAQQQMQPENPPQPQINLQRKIGTLTIEERRIKIQKYLEKRKKRTWKKKISYDCRKRVADSRLRIKGRFVTRDQAYQMLGPDYAGKELSNSEIKELLNDKFGGSDIKPKDIKAALGELPKVAVGPEVKEKKDTPKKEENSDDKSSANAKKEETTTTTTTETAKTEEKAPAAATSPKKEKEAKKEKAAAGSPKKEKNISPKKEKEASPKKEEVKEENKETKAEEKPAEPKQESAPVEKKEE